MTEPVFHTPSGGPPPPPPPNSLEVLPDGTYRVTGYTPEEAGELLAAIRNHLALLTDLLVPHQVRYRPEGV